ncbi:hypothetical protein BGZ94_000394 [Podila epigama]|nr:hypothetical protein BGZ94_000394 [Podila epigama]
MPVRPQPPTDKDGRQDVLLLKQQLAEALGDNGPSYWQALTDFVSGKLNRQEFDFYANLYLSRKNAPLHNQFILANIHNAQREAPPPSTRSVGMSKGKKNKDGSSARDLEPKRRKIKNQVLSLGKSERERIKSLKDQSRNNGAVVPKLKEHRISKPLAPSLPQPAQLAEYNRGAHAPLCFDSKELPNFEAMKDRMTAVAMENGLLGGVHDDCIELMLHALESHIKSVISNCIIKLRTNRALGISVPKRDLCQGGSHARTPGTSSGQNRESDDEKSHGSYTEPSGSRQGEGVGGGDEGGGEARQFHGFSHNQAQGPPHNTNGTTTITARDLAFAIDISPSMLVENPVNVEKLMSILMEESDEDGEDDANEDQPNSPSYTLIVKSSHCAQKCFNAQKCVIKGLLATTACNFRLKAAIWLVVGEICESQQAELNVVVTPQLVASLTEVVFAQAESLGKDLEAFSRHAKRTTVSVDDVKLTARRNMTLHELITMEANKLTGEAENVRESKKRKV